MGLKSSKQQQQQQQQQSHHHHHHQQQVRRLHNHQHEQSSSQRKNSYGNVQRAYPKVNHHSALVKDDAVRFNSQEIHHLTKHKEAKAQSHPLYAVNHQKAAKPVTPPSYQAPAQPKYTPAQSPVIKRPRYEEFNIRPKLLDLQKSRSFDHLPSAPVIITAEQLIHDRARRRQKKSTPLGSSTESLHSSVYQKSASKIDANQQASSLATTKKNKIPGDLQLVLIDASEFKHCREIGKGNFGTVYRAVYQGTHHVALKTLNSECVISSSNEYDQSWSALLHEANIMTRLKHPNLLRILGVTMFGPEEKLSLVTDFMQNGSLIDYFRSNRDVFIKSNPKEVTFRLNNFGRQIFDAMLYLEERHIIHRDLAARNCLVGEGETLKVGDFGLTTVTDSGLYKGNNQSMLATRWASPEAVIFAKYSSRSDVWSYGITLWEIFSLGERPYGEMTNTAIKFELKNTSGTITRFLPQPSQFGSSETYTHLILPCLTYNVNMRPRFRDLKKRVTFVLIDMDQ